MWRSWRSLLREGIEAVSSKGCVWRLKFHQLRRISLRQSELYAMQRGSMASSNGKLVAWSAEDKDLALRELEGSIYFEATLTAATSASLGRNSCGLTVPSWFVRDHGKKFRKSALLRTELFAEPWPVNFSIWFPSRTMTQVFLFRDSDEGPNKKVPPKRRRRTSGWDQSQKKVARRKYERREEQMGAAEERSDKSTNGLNFKGSSAVYDSAIAPIRPPHSEAESLHHLPSFWKTLTASNVCQNTGASLEFPEDFWKIYGNRIHPVVKLQGIHEQSPVRTMSCCTSHTRHYLRAEWRAFVTENHLREGQELVFTLTANSNFIVRERNALSLGVPGVHTIEHDSHTGNP